MNKVASENFAKLKAWLAEESRMSLSDFCWTAGRITAFIRLQSNKLPRLTFPLKYDFQERFDEQLRELLLVKFPLPKDKIPEDQSFEIIVQELSSFFKCCFTSDRTPDELVDALRDDAEMKEEIIELIMSNNGIERSQHNTLFLQQVLSGDDDVRFLLNRQKTKSGYPYVV